MSLAAWMTAQEGERCFRDAPVRLDEGTMRCFVAGEGPPVVLLHGLLGTASAWRPVAQHLSRGATVYAADALCVGGSDRVAGLDPSLRAAALRMVAFLTAQGIGRADLVGTSYGGSVALAVAAMFPERVRSLTLHAPANPFSDIADPLIRFYRSTLGRWVANRAASVPEALQSLVLRRMYGDPSRVVPGSMESYTASLRVPGTIAMVLNILARWDQDMGELLTMLPLVRHIPTLLLWGDRDRAVSLESGERLAKYFDTVTMLVIPGAGHVPHEEVPAAFANAVLGFLAGVNRSASPLETPWLDVMERSDAA